MGSQKFSDDIAHGASAEPMNDTHLAPISQAGVVEVTIEQPFYFFGSFSSQVKFR